MRPHADAMVSRAACPAASGLAPTEFGESFEPSGVDGVVMKPLWLQNRVLLTK